MAERRSPLYLERAMYRRRRLTDALRLLPIAMFILFLLPLLWDRAVTPAAFPIIYIFGVWFGGILMAFWFNQRLMRDGSNRAEDKTNSEAGGR